MIRTAPSSVPRVALTVALLLQVLSLPVGAQSPTGGLPELQTIEGCGKPLPMVIANADQLRQFGIDADAFRKNEGHALAAAVSSLCAASPKYRDAIDHGIRQVRVINAQGADEPHPYVGRRVLLLEFAGGAFDQAALKRDLGKALDRGSVINPAFNCAKASSAIEKMICDEPDLAQDDAAMASSYKEALKALQAQPGLSDKLRQEQRQWLAERDQHCSLGSDPANPQQADGIVNCLLAAYQQRIAALDVLGRPPTIVSLPADLDADGTYVDEGGKLEFSSQADGSANFSLTTQAERGICAVDGNAKREGTSNYVFTDPDAECRISFLRRDDVLSVSTDGPCFSAYCGVHALGLDGDYNRKARGKLSSGH